MVLEPRGTSRANGSQSKGSSAKGRPGGSKQGESGQRKGANRERSVNLQGTKTGVSNTMTNGKSAGEEKNHLKHKTRSKNTTREKKRTEPSFGVGILRSASVGATGPWQGGKRREWNRQVRGKKGPSSKNNGRQKKRKTTHGGGGEKEGISRKQRKKVRD